MTTREFAESLCKRIGYNNIEEVYRQLLVFAATDTRNGYSPSNPARQRARERAERGGYFWLPCVICLNWYGGQEWLDTEGGGSLMLTKSEGVGVCPNCSEEAERLNKLYPRGIANDGT